MAQGQENNNDSLWVIVAIFVVVLLIGYFFGNNMKSAYLFVQMLWVKGYIFLFSLTPLDIPKTLINSFDAIDIYRPKEWSLNDLKNLAEDMKLYNFPPLALIFGLYAYKVWKKNPANSYKRIHTRQTLCKSEVRKWPWIAPILSLNLVKESIDKGPWAMAKNPLDFCRKYKLLNGTQLDNKKARKLFASQLGTLWQGPKKLKIHEKALFACFIAQACRDKDGAKEGLKVLALSISEGKPDFSWVDGLIKKHYDNPIVQNAISKNAYTTTVMSSVLKAARANGVLPPSHFLWLKPINRSLWFALNCVGRRTPFCEVAGIHAHKLAEDIAGHPLERPYVENAVQALERALSEVKFEAE